MTTTTRALRRAGLSVSALAAGEALNKITRFAAAVLLARSLTLSEFGLVNVGIAISGILLSLTSLGLPEYGARAVAIKDSRSQTVMGIVLASRGVAWLLLSIVATGVTLAWYPSLSYLVVLAALMAGGLTFSADWLLRGREQMASVAGSTAVGGGVVLLGTVAVVSVSPNVTTALAIFTLGEASAATMTWVQARVGVPRKPSTAAITRALRVAWPLGASSLLIYLSYANLDTILLAALHSNREAGLYSGPYRLFLAASALCIFAAFALLPMLSRLYHAGDNKGAQKLLRGAFVPLSGYGLVVLALAEWGGDQLMSVLFGAPFAQTRAALIILCMALSWNGIGLAAGYGLIGQQRNRQFLYGAAVTGVVNMILMVILIPRYGSNGAAIATTAGMISGAIVWLALRGVIRHTAGICVLLVIGATGGVVAALVPAASLPVSIVTALMGLAMLPGTYVVAAYGARRARRN